MLSTRRKRLAEGHILGGMASIRNDYLWWQGARCTTPTAKIQARFGSEKTAPQGARPTIRRVETFKELPFARDGDFFEAGREAPAVIV